MTTPAVNLLIFVGAMALAALLYWPAVVVFRALRARRRYAERIQLEDSLKLLYDREGQGAAITLAGLADALRMSSAAGLELLDNMRSAGLVSTIDGRLVLTREGSRYALQIIRAHRLWERYLADETGVQPLRWHDEAERHEHTLSPEQADALASRLGNPRFDPHGDPIPTSDGAFPEKKVISLARLEVGEEARVVHVEDEPDVVYAQLVALGIYVGMELRLQGRTEERIIVEADGRKLVLAPIVAGNISIERLTKSEISERGGSVEIAPETLNTLRAGESAVVTRLSPACRGVERRRLMDLGIIPGTRIEYKRRALTGGLTSYRVRGTEIALRHEQAGMVAIRDREVLAS